MRGRRCRRRCATCLRGCGRGWRGGSRACRCLRFGRRDWTCWRRLLLCQLGNCHFHGTLNRDVSEAFGFIDPAISGQSLVGFLAQSLQILHALFRPDLFVIACALGRPNDRQHDYTKERKEKNNPEPHRQWSARLGNLTKGFGSCHISSPSSKIQSGADRGLERETSEARFADKQNRALRRWR